MIDIVYLAKNRLEFTVQSFGTMVANTNWALVGRLIVYDDDSRDGTYEFLETSLGDDWPKKPECVLRKTDRVHFGNPVAIMNNYLGRVSADLFAKIDNDVILPPGWLDACVDVMKRNPDLQLLGIEPPDSRRLKEEGYEEEIRGNAHGYLPCQSIGGIGLMRRAAFAIGEMRPHSTYGGFTDWQQRHPEIIRGWIAPALKVFLLDRMTCEPWSCLSKVYVYRRWQREWYRYPESASHLWSWWNPRVYA